MTTKRFDPIECYSCGELVFTHAEIDEDENHVLCGRPVGEPECSCYEADHGHQP